MDNLDCICCLSILFHVIGTIIFGNPGPNGVNTRALEYFLLSCNLVALIAIVSLFVLMLLEHRFKGSSIVMLSKSMARLVQTLQPELQRRRSRFFQALKEAEGLDSMLDVGVQVSHGHHGRGVIQSIRGNVAAVLFNDGKRRHYDEELALTRLTILARECSDDMVTLRPFVAAAATCLRDTAFQPTEVGLEALFVVIRACADASKPSPAASGSGQGHPLQVPRDAVRFLLVCSRLQQSAPVPLQNPRSSAHASF